LGEPATQAVEQAEDLYQDTLADEVNHLGIVAHCVRKIPIIDDQRHRPFGHADCVVVFAVHHVEMLRQRFDCVCERRRMVQLRRHECAGLERQFAFRQVGGEIVEAAGDFAFNSEEIDQTQI